MLALKSIPPIPPAVGLQFGHPGPPIPPAEKFPPPPPPALWLFPPPPEIIFALPAA